MSRPLLLFGVVFWAGATVALSGRRWFARRPLRDRLAPHTPGTALRPSRSGVLSADSFRDVIGPIVRDVGQAVSSGLGVQDDLGVRLRRIGSPMDAVTFRLRQLAWAVAAFTLAAAACIALQLPGALVVVSLLVAPTLAFLVVEAQLISATAAYRHRVVLELPVVAEQLGLLLSSGYSLGGAVARLADRGKGATGADLRRVVARTRHGLDDGAALREWAALADIEHVHRLVSVLALNREAGDLGRLIAEEARAIRRDVQRDLIATLDTKNQQVWIPVTVAALVPGAVFIAIPFIHALRAFGGA